LTASTNFPRGNLLDTHFSRCAEAVRQMGEGAAFKEGIDLVGSTFNVPEGKDV